eukprot:TRINITY_DN12094_c0_g1_i1.p2 TRINITY_DN12094_c0_g1~~TRINITY_DN12094_c0_g1_i1.p2  ORF type:complete len:121 (-),score=19.59 TRINITY_DN12094_c0_g1_i1:239-601(-)
MLPSMSSSPSPSKPSKKPKSPRPKKPSDINTQDTSSLAVMRKKRRKNDQLVEPEPSSAIADTNMLAAVKGVGCLKAALTLSPAQKSILDNLAHGEIESVSEISAVLNHHVSRTLRLLLFH